jgi:hypothetical protein
MVYLVIKELAKVAEDVLMVTSSIMKDMQPNLEVIYRPNAIRAVCRVIDVSLILVHCMRRTVPADGCYFTPVVCRAR